MAVDVETLVVRLEGRINDFEKAMAKAQRSATTASAKITATFATMNRKLKSGLSALGIGLSVGFLTTFIKNAAKAGEAIGDSAEKLGISAEAFQELAFAADQSGSSVEALEPAFKAMANFLGGIERGSKSAEKELNALGLTLADIRGKSPDQAFTILLDAIGKIEDPLRRSAELVKVFSKAGVGLTQLAIARGKGIDALRQQARDLGIVLSNETIAKAQQAGDVIGQIGLAAEAAGINMAAGFLDAMEALRDIVTSQAFQDGLQNAAKNVGNFVEFMTKLDPRILELLLSGAAGFAVGGPFGAAGAAAFDLGKQLGDAAIDAAAKAAGVRPAAKGDRLVPSHTGPFAEGFETVQPVTPALKAAAAKSVAGPQVAPRDVGEIDKINETIDALNEQREALGKTGKALAEYEALTRAGITATDALAPAVIKAADALFDAEAAQARLNDVVELFQQTTFDVFDRLIIQGEEFSDVLKDIAVQLARAAIQALLLGQGPFASLFGTGAGGANSTTAALKTIAGAIFPGLAEGGPVTAGRAYRVGERGPEMFVPNVSGQIIPNNGGGGQGALLQVHVIPSSYFDVTVDQRSAVQAQKISVQVVTGTAKSEARRRELSG